jgi:hypothetical protein
MMMRCRFIAELKVDFGYLNLNSPLLAAGMNPKSDHPQQSAWRRPKVGAEIP